MISCPECDSTELEWSAVAQKLNNVADGRLCLSEIGVILVLGCRECSETIRLVDATSNAGLKLLEYIPFDAERPVETVELP